MIYFCVFYCADHILLRHCLNGELRVLATRGDVFCVLAGGGGHGGRGLVRIRTILKIFVDIDTSSVDTFSKHILQEVFIQPWPGQWVLYMEEQCEEKVRVTDKQINLVVYPFCAGPV